MFLYIFQIVIWPPIVENWLGGNLIKLIDELINKTNTMVSRGTM